MKQSTINNYQLAIINVLHYFSFFDYPPTFEEIYTFLPIKISKNELEKELEHLVKQKKLFTFTLPFLISPRYTVGEYSIKQTQNSKLKTQIYNSNLKTINNLAIEQFNNYQKRHEISQKKLQNWRFRLYIKLLSFFPQIKLVGLSGSIAMMNAKEEDDIDLFIITAKKRLFTGRLIAILLAELLGLRRKKFRGYGLEVRGSKKENKNKVCLNLFFDESNLKIPQFKQTEFVAHEALQMKPIINKNQTYEKFLKANRWVFRLFPNRRENLEFRIQNSELKEKNKKILNFKFLTVIFHFSFLIFNFIMIRIEVLLKKFQLFLINRHKTTEIITDTQLWFHPDDFEKKIKIKAKKWKNSSRS